MINAKDELLEILSKTGQAEVLCAEISYLVSYFPSSLDMTLRLPVKYKASDFEDFMSRLDFSYDEGYGRQYLHGTVWLSDGTWLSRDEYDGSEYWRHNYCPDIPNTLKGTYT